MISHEWRELREFFFPYETKLFGTHFCDLMEFLRILWKGKETCTN